MSEQYKEAIYAHKDLVKQSLYDMGLDLTVRSRMHDMSKFSPEEQEIYERVTPKFKDLKYGTPEYEAVKAELGPALEHHYTHNDHHPEHFENGVADMNAMQLNECIADVYAVIRRNPTASVTESMETWRDKYKIEPQLYSIILNTIIWLSREHGSRKDDCNH